MWRHVLYLVALWRVCACAAYLLPTDVKPRHYDVSLIFDVDPKTNFSFYGVVDILLTVKKPTSKIVLHAQGYQIEKKSITLDGDLPPKIVDTKLNNTYNMFTVKLDSTLQAGKNYTLTIPFYGNLMASLDGAYISSYMDKSSNTKEYLVVTQFEAISARKSFPCFDEPMYKATFSLTIGHHRDYSCISNMPLYNSSEVNTAEDIWPWTEIATTFKKEQQEFIWDQFETSVPMSTYLIAFVVSKFAHVDSPGHLSSTRFRIWARKDAIDQTEYAANLGPRTLSFFEEYFNVSFPLPKQDMIAIPDFSAGAMENWGLITYRETALLYDKKQSSFLNKERVAEVIAHELAHQWFGNLVTMKWWSDLWLNEGFATFVASVGVARVEPAWRADLNYAVESIMAVMSLDALESSHPVSVPLDDPKRISEIFDEISYRKGAALIRMMTMFLGEDVFRKAIHDYLVKYSYSNAQQDDLWAELTRVSLQYGGLTRNVTVKQVMDTWTTQTGYPIIEARRDYAESTVTVTQKRFLPVGSKASTAVSWWIPLNVICQSEVGQPSDPVEWLASDEGVQNKHRFEHAANPAEWILFNPDMIAPYRINYDQRNWELLTNTLTSDKFTDIPVLGRVQLLSDAFSLAWNNQLDYSVTLSIANYLQRETEHLPLSIGLRMLSVLDGVLKRSADYGAFQKFVRKLITAQYQQAGGLALKRVVNGDDLTSVKMQTLTSSWACHTKVPQCEENAMELYREWMDMANPDENNPIPLDLRRTVYCVGIARGSVAEWRFALARLQRTNVAAAKDLLQKALACTREVWILKQYLEWSVTDGSIVRSQDAGRVISEITSSTVGFYVARDFIYTRIDDIVGAFKGQGRKLGVLLNTFLRQFTTQAELDEFLIWKDKNAKYMEDIKLKLSQGIEAAKLNIDWLKRNQKLVIDKLREFST